VHTLKRPLARALLLALLFLTLSRSSSTGPPAPVAAETGAAGFEALVGQVGRAEAWYLLNDMTAGPAVPLATSLPALQATVPPTLTHAVYLPLVTVGEAAVMVERRAIWVTRYDWTQFGQAASPGAIDAIVEKVAGAGFNTIFFQVRAAGDAYYRPGLEPWASRLSAGPVSATLGLDPGWDPLARMIQVGHAAGLEVHAYVNVYTAWLSPPSAAYGDLWPPATTPPQMFDRLTYGPTYAAHPGEYSLGYGWRQYTGGTTPLPMPLSWKRYLWASPGVDEVDAHVAAVIADIVDRYPVDGVHLDLVRYAGPGYSYDPSSNAAAGSSPSAARAQWQRDRITALVDKVRAETHQRRPEAIVSAAVWPYYVDKWGWGLSEGYSDYYQDAKGWLGSGAVDAIVPMLYGGICDDPARWQTLMSDFIADSGGRQVLPGIGGSYDDFDAIAWRIEEARLAGAKGHALFSYGSLDAEGYWDDLAAGPYKVLATVP
jgi:uncharacterized lipoprotein YddW (UPF0748 family)